MGAQHSHIIFFLTIKEEETMAKSKNNVDINFDIDTEPIEMVATEIVNEPKNTIQVEKKITDNNGGNGLISCLRNEKIIVRHINKPSMVTNPKHVLFGGMAENATRTFVVPRLSSGVFVNVLTNSEKDFLEYALGLEKNAMSVHKKIDNFWDDSNSNGINRVRLGKEDNHFDLSNPVEYLKVKILLANKDFVCPSIQELQDKPKATYQFVIIRESDESKVAKRGLDLKLECYKKYGKIEDDKDKLRMVIELMTGRTTSPKDKIENLQVKVGELISSDAKTFMRVVTDEYLDMKVLIRKCVDNNLISKRNNLYYLTKDGSPLCELGEESTINIASKYLSHPKRQELKFMLEEKVKE